MVNGLVRVGTNGDQSRNTASRNGLAPIRFVSIRNLLSASAIRISVPVATMEVVEIIGHSNGLSVTSSTTTSFFANEQTNGLTIDLTYPQGFPSSTVNRMNSVSIQGLSRASSISILGQQGIMNYIAINTLTNQTLIVNSAILIS